MITTTDLVETIAKETGFPKTQVKTVLEVLGVAKTAALARGEDVRLTGFGTYKVVDRAQREARNPRTGEPITIAARKAVKFVPASNVDERIARGR